MRFTKACRDDSGPAYSNEGRLIASESFCLDDVEFAVYSDPPRLYRALDIVSPWKLVKPSNPLYELAPNIVAAVQTYYSIPAFQDLYPIHEYLNQVLKCDS